MLFKFVIFCFVYIFRIPTDAKNSSSEEIVQIVQRELDDLNVKLDELIKLKQQHESDVVSWKNETKILQDENKQLKEKLRDLEEDFQSQQEKVWALLWFRWLSMIKYEIEWRETVVTELAFDHAQFDEEKVKIKGWTEADERRRQVWNFILKNCTHNTHIVALALEIDKAGIEISQFSRNIAIGYKELCDKLLAMMRWRKLPKFEKEPTFNTPISWSHEINKCFLTLMFDVDKYIVWEFKTNLPFEQPTYHTVKP